jgi:hypothetical protein
MVLMAPNNCPSMIQWAVIVGYLNADSRDRQLLWPRLACSASAARLFAANTFPQDLGADRRVRMSGLSGLWCS